MGISVHRSISEGAFHFDDPDGRLADPDRLRRLRETGLVGLRRDPALDRLTRLAAQITGAGVAVVALVEAARQVFPSAYGFAGILEAERETPLSTSFSQYVVINDAPLVVPNAREHPVLRQSPAVEEYGVVAYAGYPLHDPGGEVLGALCVIESTPQVWSVEQLGMLRDLTATIETEIALRLRARQAQLCQERMQQVIDGAVHTAILAADADGVVTVMNHGAERLLGMDAASVVGTRSLAYVLRASRPLEPETGEGQSRDWLMVDGAGRERVLSVRSSVLRDSWGNLDGYTLVADDVSTRRKAETLLRDTARKRDTAFERLTELDRARNIFIATTSHELRTPLASILGYTEMLADGAAGSLSPAQLELLKRVDSNGRRLHALADDLLDLAQLDTRTATIVRAPMDGNSAAEHAWETLRPELAERGLQAQLQLSDASPQIIGDAELVEQALLSLLANAVKFTMDGGAVRLTVRASTDGVEFEVTDTGIGIPEAEQGSIFDPFFRTEQAQSLAIPGVGIGLSIVRRIVEAHQGQVHVTSRVGKGTAVLVTLPATQQATLSGPRDGGLSTGERQDSTPWGGSLEAELRLALEGSVTQFVLHYQPVVDLTSGKVVAVEALARWQHPVRGLLGPDRFIALAEATGLIHQLADWALDQAIRDAGALTHEGRELDMAVNFSAQQLDGQVVAKVQRALEKSGLRPGRLILEVTESAFVEDEETTAATYEAMSQLGVKIAIDDFGTGYSSLPHLRRYPISTLKIDRTFVAGIGQSVDDEAICESVIRLAAALGASTVGEGVETTAQYAALRSLGCLQGQGFLWSPAVPIDELGTAFAACDQVPVAAPQARMSLDKAT